jgi:hypothetical protein
MRVEIKFDGSQREFEDFCQTPQRMVQAHMLQQYQGWLQHPYPIEVEASPVAPALPGQAPGPAYYQTTPLALPAAGIATNDWGQNGYLRPAAPYGQGWRRWLPKVNLSGPVKFFLLSVCASIGVVATVKLRPPMTQATTQPQGQFTLQPIKPVPKAAPLNQKGAIPALPLVPRPGQE